MWIHPARTAYTVLLWTVLMTLWVMMPSTVSAFYKCVGPNGRMIFTDKPCSFEQTPGDAPSPPVQAPAAEPTGGTTAEAANSDNGATASPPSPTSPSPHTAVAQNGPVQAEGCYINTDSTSLVLKITYTEGKLLGVQRQATEFTSWQDDVGTRYGSKKGGENAPFRSGDALVDWAGASEPSAHEYHVAFRVDTIPPSTATQCQAEGTLVYRLGTNKQTGRVRNIRLQPGAQFRMGGIPFEVGEVKPWPFKDKHGKQRMYAAIRCLKGDLQSEDYDFIETLKLYGPDGALIEEWPNQKSTWSDAQGREGFMYNWIVDELPASMALEYALWPSIRMVHVPFKVSAPINR